MNIVIIFYNPVIVYLIYKLNFIVLIYTTHQPEYLRKLDLIEAYQRTLFYLKINHMQHSFSKVNPSDKNQSKNEQTSFMLIHDPCHPAFTGKTYLAPEKDNKEISIKNNNDLLILHDMFGALNY